MKIMKKMYKKPIIEVFDLKGENLMQMPVVSGAGSSSGDPTNIYEGE
jgi:hypothetical protein